MRAALAAAEQLTEHSDILLDPGTYHLTQGVLQISGGDIAFSAATTGTTTVEQDTASQSVFDIAAGTILIQGLGITGGHSTGDGGGIRVDGGTVTIAACSIFGNHADSKGGGIDNSGTLTILDSDISGNTAVVWGGGLRNQGGASLSILGCTIANNSSDQAAGGIQADGNNSAATILIRDTAIVGNSCGTVGGGGLALSQPTVIEGCLIAGNTSQGWGGGISDGTTVTIVNTTITGNTASSYGGGILNGTTSGDVTLVFCTVTGNTAATGGGIDHGSLLGPSEAFTITNSIVCLNTATDGPDIDSPETVSTSFSQIGSTSGYTEGNGAGDLPVGTDPLLGPLADYGGPTQTRAPLAGSPVIDAGSNAAIPAGVTTDQRGLARVFPAGGRVDIGAVEVQPATPTIVVDPAQPNPTNNPSPVVFDVTFDQPVTGFGASAISLAGSTVPGTLQAAVAGSGASYTVTVTGITGDGTVSAAVLAGTGSVGLNASGQNNLASAASATVTIDTIAPTVTINQAAGQANPTNAAPIQFLVQFSEAVSAFTAADVHLVSSIGDALDATVAAGVASYSYVVSVTGMTADSTVTATVPAGVTTDLAGNPNQGSTNTDNTVSFDNSQPSVTITPSPDQGNPGGGLSVTFAVVFSEPVIGFDATKVDLTGSTAPGALVGTVTGTGPAYTLTVTGMTAGGTVVADIHAGAVTDAAGNPNLAASGSGAVVTYVRSGTVQLAAAAYWVVEHGGPVLVVHVTRIGGAEGPLSVDYATADGTAVAGTNYTAASGTLTWADGDTADKTFTIPILDAGSAIDKAFSINLSNVSLAGALGNPTTAQVTIRAEAVLDFSQAAYQVTRQAGSAMITVHRQAGTSGAVTVHFATSDGSAIAGSDYTPVSRTLSWADGDAADKSFLVPILDNGLSQGAETINLTLDTVTGNAVLGSPSTAVITITKSHPKASGNTFTDADGDKVTFTLKGPGALLYYLTNGTGPVSEIDLIGTDPAKSVVTVQVKRAAGGDGRVKVDEIDEIDGAGLRALSLPQADLVGAGIMMNGYVGSFSIGDVSNGADIILTGLAPAKPKHAGTRITTGVIGDGTDISVAAPITSLTAVAVGHATIAAPSVGAITITGRKATKAAPAVAGDLAADVTISGVGLDPVKDKALKSLTVAGQVTGSTIRVGGSVGRVSVGSFVGSRLFAGFSGDETAGTFTADATIGPFQVTATSHGFVSSYVIASRFKNVTLTSADTNNAHTPFGFIFDKRFAGLTVKDPKLSYDTAAGGTQVLAGDLEVEQR